MGKAKKTNVLKVIVYKASGELISAMNNIHIHFDLFLQDLFIAGAETTSSSLTSMILYMILYPEVQKRIQDEIDLVVGRSGLFVKFSYVGYKLFRPVHFCPKMDYFLLDLVILFPPKSKQTQSFYFGGSKIG